MAKALFVISQNDWHGQKKQWPVAGSFYKDPEKQKAILSYTATERAAIHD